MTLPPGARRLFANESAEVDLQRHEPAIVERLLEDGDRADLHWLTASVAGARLAGWLRRCGGRRLSKRSRAFWSVVLEVEPEPGPDVGDLLWPH